ncbi:MAG: hypothetical protein IJ600_09945 [Lachnospiraceae bacterium]|nr:hypothetical protein [Lachnospiraceae bacterium]
MYLLAVLALHFVMEHHILEPAYNIFLLLPFAGLGSLTGKGNDGDDLKVKANETEPAEVAG